ncbi:TPA: hypothetical protein DCZ46_02375 [Candidatus Campbellbacteria bacterium]|uniref:Uncharacterized protein n=1 Tax=Candidatus Nomurabacteria bacterium GW2011_GWC2_42_20 TaxID=1618756 RepID=A0A0G1CFL1_9BACT|nr:MAG: hypothetical protein UU88_C0003G0033 [Parcubacteria group bacterium GW2011_GWC1_42_11]KKS48368.1 MAG: hypothetical protein UV12_C0001G0063 [Candidatus Nomurabacteria bacterium GW2011_GWC2_42_20]KKS59036.1 MAG: hypothetical protein UV24_C0009G0027 [Candidatus Nomurabacteria bacterium GW2011_GWA2_42_41]KKT09944.1 MAG: hypothetical protein UV86_C0001G0046 [Candidatus Nomurabacteria bacterium GW2011_GWB1_43_20]TAN35559.1 MAG: hypothetical protein EPN27_03320 [Patescibacteria group bacterium
MEFFPLVGGKKLPEVYHLGFSGTHFQVFVTLEYWLKFVSLTGAETHYASRHGQEYISPSIFGGSFGWYGCARVSKSLDDFVCIEVPAFVNESNTVEPVAQMRDLGSTLANIFFILQHLIYEYDEQNVEMQQGCHTQLFVVETFLSREPTQFHGAGLELAVSTQARKYLEGLGRQIELERAIEAMKSHFFMPHVDGQLQVRSWRGDFVVRLRDNGVLHMNTRGNCACLGTMPRDFGDRGCQLSSHNVDTVKQQFNLLVGIASVWQMVREGLHT